MNTRLTPTHPLKTDLYLNHLPFFIKNYHLGYLFPITYITQISIAYLYSKNELLYDENRRTIMITATFAYNDWYRYYWLFLTSFVSVCMISSAECIYYYFMLLVVRCLREGRRSGSSLLSVGRNERNEKTALSSSSSDEDSGTEDSEVNINAQKPEITLKTFSHLKFCLLSLKYSIYIWPIILQCVVIFIHGQAPKRQGDDKIPNSMWITHYIFTNFFLFSVLITISSLQIILKFLTKFDPKLKSTHSYTYKKILASLYFTIIVFMIVCGILAVTYGVEAAIWWDLTAVLELVWVLVIILYNIDIVRGVCRGFDLMRKEILFDQRLE